MIAFVSAASNLVDGVVPEVVRAVIVVVIMNLEINPVVIGDFVFLIVDSAIVVKVSQFRKQIVKLCILPKNEQMNSFLLLCNVFWFVFGRN